MRQGDRLEGKDLLGQGSDLRVPNEGSLVEWLWASAVTTTPPRSMSSPLATIPTVTASWPPTTLEALQLALNQGLLRESHHAELKREIGSGSSANEELASDLASMAIDGGVLIVGIAEDPESRTRVLSPVPLRGLKERIDQVARTRIDPPLPVEIHEIETQEGAPLGVLTVVVPASPLAPHMVGGRYRGRGDSTKHVLSDAEVLRLHAARAQQADKVHRFLDAFVAEDPFPPEQRRLAHLYIVGVPTTANRGLFHDRVNAENWSGWLHSNLLGGKPTAPFTDGFSPDLGEASQVSRRADGWTLHTAWMREDGGPSGDGRESSALELTVTEDGSLKLFCGRGSDFLRSDVQVCFETLVLGLAKRLVLACGVVTDAMGYWGRWDFGIVLTPLKGVISYRLHKHMRGATPYSASAYQETASATHAEVLNDVDNIVNRLCGRLNRALNGGTVLVPD